MLTSTLSTQKVNAFKATGPASSTALRVLTSVYSVGQNITSTNSSNVKRRIQIVRPTQTASALNARPSFSSTLKSASPIPSAASPTRARAALPVKMATFLKTENASAGTTREWLC